MKLRGSAALEVERIVYVGASLVAHGHTLIYLILRKVWYYLLGRKSNAIEMHSMAPCIFKSNALFHTGL
jgi:hypothetical protein